MFKKKISGATIVFTIMTASLMGMNSDQLPQREKDHFRVGVSAPSHQDSVKIEEKRIQQDLANGERSAHKVYINYNDIFYSAAVHYLQARGIDGSTISLEDDSLWAICFYDHNVVRHWYTGDSLVISSNSSWLSDYKYEIYNQTLGTKVEANVVEGGDFALAKTVTMVDRFWKRIYLSDGTCWQVAFWDDHMVLDWLIGQGVIMGVNNRSDCASNPYIIINYERNQYIRVKPIN